jgi:REP element-mobilizing transposase RayT
MGRHSNANLLIHVVWSTERRRPLLPPSGDATLATMFAEAARRVRCQLIICGIAVDHTHVLVRLQPTTRLAELVQRMKGAVAHDVNVDRGERSIVWQQGYWAESIGPADVGPLASYFMRQRERHDNSHPAEAWQFGQP